MSTVRATPTVIHPVKPAKNFTKSAVFIFVHGLGDDADGLARQCPTFCCDFAHNAPAIARQFKAANKLPHMIWVLPNANHNHDLMSTAWYMPTKLSPFPPSRPELEDDEDEVGIKSSIEYLVSLIDEFVAKGVPEKRIVLGGFSQGHAMAFLTGLISSKYAGKLAGLVGLSGYLPLNERISKLREEAGLPEKVDDDVQVFVARGTRDMLVPKRYQTLCTNKLLNCGVKEEHLRVKEYEGMGHIMGGAELRDLCTWLEKVLPPLD